jgi:hypothetical protein
MGQYGLYSYIIILHYEIRISVTNGCISKHKKETPSAQIKMRRLAVRQARVRISARDRRGDPLPSGTKHEIFGAEILHKSYL